MTAMALQALAPYYNEGGDTTGNAAVDKALQWLPFHDADKIWKL